MLGEIIAGRGDRLPVSALPNDGTYPTGTTQYEKRNLAGEVPVWDPEVCIQCGKCVLVCPHAVIRSKVYDAPRARRRAGDFQIARRAAAGMERAEVYPAGCGRRLHRLRHLRGCLPGAEQNGSAAESDQHAAASAAARDTSARTGISSSRLPELDRRADLELAACAQKQVQQPLFEFSGACAGCGETPYIKLLTQLFGDRLDHRQRHRLFLDLRRQSADHALHQERRRPRPGLGEFAL